MEVKLFEVRDEATFISVTHFQTPRLFHFGDPKI